MWCWYSYWCGERSDCASDGNWKIVFRYEFILIGSIEGYLNCGNCIRDWGSVSAVASCWCKTKSLYYVVHSSFQIQWCRKKSVRRAISVIDLNEARSNSSSASIFLKHIKNTANLISRQISQFIWYLLMSHHKTIRTKVPIAVPRPSSAQFNSLSTLYSVSYQKWNNFM